jgi:hypothetical protein
LGEVWLAECQLTGEAMPRAGRNEPCPCGSGCKVKNCCKQQHEPFEDHRARAYIAILARDAPLKSPISPTTPGTISGTPLELPAALLLAELPKLITPHLQRLREAIADDDSGWGWDTLTAIPTQIDTPRQRNSPTHSSSSRPTPHHPPTSRSRDRRPR